MKKNPKAAKNWAVTVSDPAPKPRRRNNRGSSMGSVARSSQSTNAAPARTPVTSALAVRGSDQPRSGPSMMPKTTPATETSDSAAPTRSSRVGCSSTERGTSARVPTTARAARPTLSPKNEFQSKNSSRIPVPNRPRMAPPPATPTHTPMARGRSASGNEVVITERVVGMIAAAPTPMNARITMSRVGSVVSIPKPAAVPKTTRPISRSPLRPYRSPRAPASRSSPANTTV